MTVANNADSAGSIGRSWSLTKGSVFRIQLIVFIAFLITIPVSGAIQIATTILQVIAAAVADSNASFLAPILMIFVFALAIGSGALLVPFWQAIKAVIYYDLRVRKEGFGISLEKNN